jgi:hypothetical protein
MGRTSHINVRYKELKKSHRKKAKSDDYEPSVYDEYDACVRPLIAEFGGDRYLERFLISQYLSIEVAFKDAVHMQLWKLAESLIERAIKCAVLPNVLSYSTGGEFDNTPLYVLVREWVAQRGKGRAKICHLFELLVNSSPESCTDRLLGYAAKIFAYGMISLILKLKPGLDKRGLVRAALITCNSDGIDKFQTIKALVEGGASVTGCYIFAKEEVFTDAHLIEYLRSVTSAKELENYDNRLDVLDAKGHSELHKAILKGNIKRAKKLVKKGANIGAKTAADETPYELALKAIEFLK